MVTRSGRLCRSCVCPAEQTPSHAAATRGESVDTQRSPLQPMPIATLRQWASCPCSGPGQRVRDLVQDRVADVVLGVQRGQRRAQADGPVAVAADARPPLRVVVGDLPVAQPVPGEQVLGHRVGVSQVHAQDRTTRRRQSVGGALIVCGRLVQPGVQPLAHLVGRQRGALALVPGDDHAGGRHARDAGQSEPLPQTHAMIVP